MIHPFNFIKKRMQNSGQSLTLTLKQLKDQEGVSFRALTKGLSISGAKTFCSQAIYIPFFIHYLELAKQLNSRYFQHGYNSMASTVAGYSALVSTYWMDRW